MKKRKTIGYFLIIVIMFILGGKLLYINLFNHEKYVNKKNEKTTIYVMGTSAPRGRILDKEGNILVDNIGINTIIYNKIKGITVKDELEIAEKLANILSIPEAKINELKEYWLLKNNDGKELITKEEYELVKERKLTNNDIKKLKLERITEDKLNKFSNIDKKIAHIYALMNTGYAYQKKEIIKNPNMEEYAKVLEENIPGITGEMTWERTYNYGSLFKSILGTVSNIPKEERNDYLNKGYELTDVVGISYLEKEYEEFLKGTKATYKVNKDNTLTLISEAKKGNDLVLSIDIKLQQKIEDILKEKIKEGKKYRNTEYYHDSYALVSEPLTGAILAFAGIRYNSDGTFSDIASNIINTSYTMGSAVKGATIAVGYQNDLIKMGDYILDSCVKLNLVPAKCSHARLGRINDLDALAESSNYYQYLIAINLVGKKYSPNMVLGATKKHFDIYREMLGSFGLGEYTEIDLPKEQVGIKGSTIADDLLLNLAIGQYDTYTPIELLQYINSVASGLRIKPSLMQQITNNGNVIKTHEVEVLNKVNVDEVYLKRIRDGLEQVLIRGTGRGFTNQTLNAVGKTGTSESFYDSDFDGINDVETITSTFAGYFPKENPKYSVVVITPNISHKNGLDNTKYYGAYKITRAITDYLGGITS